MKLTRRTLESMVARWKTILRMSDWEIAVELKRAKDMSMENVMGTCTHTLAKRIAYIEILNPRDYSSDIFDQDAERTVVHELLHCHFAPFEARNGTPEDIAQEQVIHAISTALVELDRKSAK